MKLYFFILFMTYCLCGYSFSTDSLHIEYIEIEDKYYEITLHNASSDTLYLFDSYLKPCFEEQKYYGYFYESKYLHRHSKRSKTYKLSLIPIIDNVCHDDHNQIYIGIDKVAQRSQMLYSFQTILPNKSLSIRIRMDALKFLEYIRDILVDKKYCYLRNIRPNHKIVKRLPSVVNVELAIYKENYQLLKSQNDSGFDINLWWYQQFNYEIVSIPIKVNQ